jgi:hypothetical protein
MDDVDAVCSCTLHSLLQVIDAERMVAYNKVCVIRTVCTMIKTLHKNMHKELPEPS